MQELSVKQKRVLEYIRKYTRDKGYPPSVREICDGLQFQSTSTAHGYLQRLEKRGYIRRDAARPRAIELIQDQKIIREMVEVPVVGRVAAGLPVLAEQNIEDYLSLPLSILNNNGEDAFILHVTGESMINAGILHGDRIIVRSTSDARNGDIVVAMIGDESEATVKRFFKESGKIRLQPENDNMEPIYSDRVIVLGRVIALVREY